MVLTTKHKMILYRRFRKDIWGYCYTDLECLKILKKKKTKSFWLRSKFKIQKSNLYLLKSKYLKFFFELWWRKKKTWRKRRSRYIYAFDRPSMFKRWLKFNKRFVSIRLTRLYFLTFQDHQFRKLFRKSAKMDGNFELNYLRFLEGRVVTIAYRLNISSDIFWLLHFIKEGCNFFLESRALSVLNIIIPIGKMITIKKKWHMKVAKQLFKRIKTKTLLFPTPKFLYASYKFFYFYLLRYPKRRDLVYPFAIDLQRITGYY